MISLQHKSDWFFTVLWKKKKKTPSWWIALRETQKVVLWLVGEAVAVAHLSCCLLLPKPSAFSLASRKKLPVNLVVPTRDCEFWRKQSKSSSRSGAEQRLAGVSSTPPAAGLCVQPQPDPPPAFCELPGRVTGARGCLLFSFSLFFFFPATDFYNSLQGQRVGKWIICF